MIMTGHLLGSRLTFTKSNMEIEPVIQKLKEVQEKTGSGVLKRYETDCVNGDGRLWNQCFPELSDGVSHHVKRKLPGALICSKEYMYICCVSGLNNWALSVSNKIKKVRE